MSSFIRVYLAVPLILFFLVIFVLRSYLQYKATGISPFVLKKGVGEPLSEYIGTWFKIDFLLIVILETGIIFDWIHTWQASYILERVGISLTLIAFVAMAYAQKSMADSWRIGIDKNTRTKLVTGGLFRYSRNPFFTGILVFLAGLFFLTPTVHGIYLFWSSYLLISVQIKLEEAYLLATHGEEYHRYMSQTGRYFPTVLKHR